MPRFVFLATFCLGSQQGCTDQVETGTLLAHGPDGHYFEIYRIASSEPLQFVSERLGTFNKPLELNTGMYLALADCSSQIVLIKPNRQADITAHAVTFTPVGDIAKTDRFSIQCSRYDKARFRQLIENRYQINIFSGQREILVGMVPLAINLESEKSTTINFQLASVSIKADTNLLSKFFVSPEGSHVSATLSQGINRKLHLLPGQYRLELNGTSLDLDLKTIREHVVEAGRLKVVTPQKAEIDRAFQIKGSPLFVEINNNHWLNLDETYIVLPGDQTARLEGSDKVHTLAVAANQDTVMSTHAVRVDMDCAPFEWNCLGSRKVYLYEKDSPYPFAIGTTDVPILHNSKDVWLSVEGGSGIRHQVDTKKELTLFKAGVLTLTPRPSLTPGFETDLARIEPKDKGTTGYSLDIDLSQTTKMTLIKGWYVLASYTRSTQKDGARKRRVSNISISSRKPNEATFSVSFPTANKLPKSLSESALKPLQIYPKNAVPTRLVFFQ